MGAKREKILVVTPSARGGPWTILRETMEALEGVTFIVITLGAVKDDDKKFGIYRIPYFNHDEGWGQRLSSGVLLSLVFELPLLALSLVLMLIHRPKIVIGNGLLPSLALAFPAKLIGSKVICFYHGNIKYYLSKASQRVVRIISKFVSHFFVNSEGSMEDLSVVVTHDKITVLEHWADDIFFLPKDRARCREELGLKDKFVVLHVGRIDIDKHCDLLIRVIEQIGDRIDILFLFAGVGNLGNTIQEFEKEYGNVKYLGYIGDVAMLAKLYSSADLVWSSADVTYVDRTGIEALASGTPIIIPDISAFSRKRGEDIKIRPDLIPEGVGWIVDHRDAQGISKLILDIKGKGVSSTVRAECARYAKLKHSKRNLLPAIEKLHSLLPDKESR